MNVDLHTTGDVRADPPSSIRLGKLPSRVDVRTLALARYVDRAELPAPPARFDITPGVIEWPMYANDRIGDCTVAAAAHMVEGWTAAATGRPTIPSEQAVLEAFDAVKLTDPVTGEEGAIELDVLKRWRKVGVAEHRIGAFTRLSVADHMLVRTASFIFGGLYIGLQLPLTAAGQETWSWPGTLGGDAAPGSWGGHAVNVVGYDAERITVVTWGALKELTWEFWDRYCDEAYALISKDFLRDGRSPAGFDMAALRRDLALVTDTAAAPHVSKS